MNILIPTSSYPVKEYPNWAPFLGDTAAALAERGHNVFVLVFAPENRREEYRQANAPGVFVTAYPFFTLGRQRLRDAPGILPSLQRSMFAGIQLPFYLIASAIELLRAVRRHKIDVIHAMWYLPMGFLAVLLKPVHQKPVVVTALGADLYLRRSFLKALLRFVSRRAAVNVFCSRHLKARARSCGMDLSRSAVVPNGIRFEKFQCAAAEHAERKITIACAKRLLKEKRLELLFKAFEGLPSAWKEQIEIVIAGEGPHRAALEKASRAAGLSKRVHFPGEIPQNEMPAFLSSVDIFIDTSPQEGLATSNMEAMASGCLLIAPDDAGNRDLIVHGENGFLYQQGCPDALQEMITFVLQNFFDQKVQSSEDVLRKRQAFTLSAAANALRKFDVSEVAAYLEEIYGEAELSLQADTASGRASALA